MRPSLVNPDPYCRRLLHFVRPARERNWGDMPSQTHEYQTACVGSAPRGANPPLAPSARFGNRLVEGFDVGVAVEIVVGPEENLALRADDGDGRSLLLVGLKEPREAEFARRG